MSQLAGGLRFVAREPVVRVVIITGTLGALLIDPLAPVVLPVYASREFGDPFVLGLMIAAYGVGGMLGIGVFTVLNRRLSRRGLYVGAYVAYAVSSFALFPLPPLVLALGALVLIGTTAGAIDPLERLLRHERTPPEVRGRVAALALAAPRLATPVAVLGAGLLIEFVGLRGTLLIFAVGNSLISVWVILAPGLRRADAQR